MKLRAFSGNPGIIAAIPTNGMPKPKQHYRRSEPIQIQYNKLFLKPLQHYPVHTGANYERKDIMESTPKQVDNQPVGSVMVVGAGISGMQSALDLANSGYYVYLVEKTSAIGGIMSQLDKTFPTNDCAM